MNGDLLSGDSGEGTRDDGFQGGAERLGRFDDEHPRNEPAREDDHREAEKKEEPRERMAVPFFRGSGNGGRMRERRSHAAVIGGTDINRLHERDLSHESRGSAADFLTGVGCPRLPLTPGRSMAA